VVDASKLFTTKLQEWEDYYNFERPHGALGGQTPYERLRSKMKASGVSGHRQLHRLRCRLSPELGHSLPSQGRMNSARAAEGASGSTTNTKSADHDARS